MRLWPDGPAPQAFFLMVDGGGVAEEGFLRALSDLIGDYSYSRAESHLDGGVRRSHDMLRRQGLRRGAGQDRVREYESLLGP